MDVFISDLKYLDFDEKLALFSLIIKPRYSKRCKIQILSTSSKQFAIIILTILYKPLLWSREQILYELPDYKHEFKGTSKSFSARTYCDSNDSKRLAVVKSNDDNGLNLDQLVNAITEIHRDTMQCEDEIIELFEKNLPASVFVDNDEQSDFALLPLFRILTGELDIKMDIGELLFYHHAKKLQDLLDRGAEPPLILRYSHLIKHPAIINAICMPTSMELRKCRWFTSLEDEELQELTTTTFSEDEICQILACCKNLDSPPDPIWLAIAIFKSRSKGKLRNAIELNHKYVPGLKKYIAILCERYQYAIRNYIECIEHQKLNLI